MSTADVPHAVQHHCVRQAERQSNLHQQHLVDIIIVKLRLTHTRTNGPTPGIEFCALRSYNVASGDINFNDFPDDQLNKISCIYWLIPDFYAPPLKFL